MLKNNIERRVANTKFESNKSLFAREANLNRDEIVRILSGKIKNPGIYTISKIAKVLNCSVDDLLGHIPTKKDFLHSNQDDFNEKLCFATLEYISNYVKSNKLENITAGKAFLALDTIYNFSYEKGLAFPEEAFADWVCKSSLK